ncbi:hypothetical protein [Idiomarina ramblicola]|uniref:Uncharacterized protein n=1 Tax=Idiomarina ramblicola TaxID=263724 RepID=A0A432YYD6_9GAMM|nr:hypothetical protein [Idiomarina ramblicola]RUO68353.1 hypothetical protein CWI78_09035 [Idiomarina ramblicola]
MLPIDHSAVSEIASEGQIAQLISDKKISLLCKVSARKALVITKEGKVWYARAHGRFNGYCYLYNKDAVECLRKGSAKITASRVSTEGFIDWSTDSPFKIDFPISYIEKWEPLDKPKKPELLHALFNPTAHEPVLSQLDRAVNSGNGDNDFTKFLSKASQVLKNANKGTKAALNMREIEIHKLDLLVDLDRLKELVQPIESSQTSHQDPEGKERWSLNRKLESVGLKPTRLHQVLYRVMEASEDKSAKAIFNLIEKDFYSEGQELNVADTITEITDIYLYWEDSSGKNRRNKFKTLEDRLTKLRKLG